MPLPAKPSVIARRGGHVAPLRVGVILVALAGAAAHFVHAWGWRARPGVAPIDIYNHYYPNMIRAADVMQDGTRGLFWNASQSCGQPFFGISSTGMLYPANVFFLLVDPDLALRLVTGVNLWIAAVSMFFLCRHYGLRDVSALCGGLAFAYGNASMQLATWTPLVSGPYVWLPAILLACERVLLVPSARRGLVLALTITVALLPGFPQTVVFAYQLIALRVLWELGSGRIAQPRTTLGVVASALCLPVLLTAVSLVPGLEMARLSVRGTGLSTAELGGGLGWNSLRNALLFRSESGNPVILLPCLLASCSVIPRVTRRIVGFYLCVGLLYLLLGLGSNTPLFGLYTKLPLGDLFRLPIRFLWITSFCLAALTAFGAEAIVRPERVSRVGRWTLAGLLPLSALALHWLYLGGLKPVEWGVMAATLAAALLAHAVRVPACVAGSVVVTALTMSLLAFPYPVVGALHLRPFPWSRLAHQEDLLAAPAAAFATLTPRLTPDDRVYFVYLSPGMRKGASVVGLGPKTASIFGAAAVHDYEPQPAQRFASYYTLMRTGRRMRHLGDYYMQFEGMMAPRFKRRLLDLAAGRYLVVESAAEPSLRALSPPPPLLWEGKGMRVYENPHALPRAFYVSRVETVPDAEALLTRLADGTDDFREVALIEEPLASGFTGSPRPSDDARVTFVTNEPEHVVLRVEAPARGFVHLSDQYFPGWIATVNDVPTHITRANYLFRLVEVPTGTSVVEFRYQPWSVRIGAAVSGLTIASIVAVAVVGRRRRRRT